MAIIYEREVSGPATHALVIGVREYPRFPGGNLDSASRSAAMFATWMVQRFHNASAPLATLDWVFFDLFQIERARQLAGDKLAYVPPLTTDVVKDSIDSWNHRLQQRPGSNGVFYFSGRAVNQGPDTALLLPDVEPEAGGSAISLPAVEEAVGSLDANLLFLIDADQPLYPRPLDLWPRFPPSPRPTIARKVVLQASRPGSEAGFDPAGTSLFAKALMASLELASEKSFTGKLTARALAVLVEEQLHADLSRQPISQRPYAKIEGDFVFHEPSPEATPPTDWKDLASGRQMPGPLPELAKPATAPPPPPAAVKSPDSAAPPESARRSRGVPRKRRGDSTASDEFPPPAQDAAADSGDRPSARPFRPSGWVRKGFPKEEGVGEEEPVFADDEPGSAEPDDDDGGDRPDVDEAPTQKPVEERAPVPAVVPAKADEANTEFVADDAETERDELARAVLAIGLARRLHRIWRNANEVPAAAEADEARAAFVVHLDAPWGGGKTTFANFLERVLDPLPAGRGPAAFLRQRYAGADIGGIFLEDPPADEAAAKRLAKLPIEVRRPWIIAPFNAWQVEHCSPPWWVFYQAIRKRCFDSILAQGDSPWAPMPERSRAERWGRRLDSWWLSKTRRLIARLSRKADPAGAWRRRLVAAHDLKLRDRGRAAAAAWAPWQAPLRRLDLWLDLWLREFRWRLGNPKVRSLLLTAAASLAVLVLLWAGGIVGPKAGGGGMSYAAGGIGLLLGGLTGITGLWGLGALFTESIVPGTDTLAERLSLGSGDPFARFRRHFTRTIELVRRPVLVVVDDLDRCKPDFVVDIVRGMQTLLRSPRVVFVILGDRDWIERAFEAHHQAMSKVDVGPEQTFGARFVEKAIQMSFLLPAMEEDTRLAYVRRVLLGERAETPVNAAPPIDAETARAVRETVNRESEKAGSDPFDTKAMLAKALEELAQRPGAAPAHADLEVQVKQEVNDTLAINATTSQAIESGVVHQLEALAPHFPPNPRQIKRIVNTVTIYYAVALQRRDREPDAAFRTQLALWVIIMIEWPETWRLIASFPELVEIVQSEDVEKALTAPGVELPGSPAAVRKAVERILADPELKSLIRGRTGPPLDRSLVPYLAQLTPLHSRKRRLDGDDDEPPEAPAAKKDAKKTGGAR